MNAGLQLVSVKEIGYRIHPETSAIVNRKYFATSLIEFKIQPTELRATSAFFHLADDAYRRSSGN
jgi:hypothetical protein